MPQRASTQSTLSIVDIKDDIVIMTGGRYRAVMRVKAINFDLLSEDEQDAIIFAYASLINALDFPVQIVIKTRQLNIASYINYLDQFKQAQPNSALKAQIASYQSFVQKLVVENNVLFKTFYVIVPYDGIAVNKASIFDPITNLLPGKSAGAHAYSEKEFEAAKGKLLEHRNSLMSQFQRIGLRTSPLVGRELVELYYNLYNPELSGTEQLRQEIDGYTTAMVHPSVQ